MVSDSKWWWQEAAPFGHNLLPQPSLLCGHPRLKVSRCKGPEMMEEASRLSVGWEGPLEKEEGVSESGMVPSGQKAGDGEGPGQRARRKMGREGHCPSPTYPVPPPFFILPARFPFPLCTGTPISMSEAPPLLPPPASSISLNSQNSPQASGSFGAPISASYTSLSLGSLDPSIPASLGFRLPPPSPALCPEGRASSPAMPGLSWSSSFPRRLIPPSRRIDRPGLWRWHPPAWGPGHGRHTGRFPGGAGEGVPRPLRPEPLSCQSPAGRGLGSASRRSTWAPRARLCLSSAAKAN